MGFIVGVLITGVCIIENHEVLNDTKEPYCPLCNLRVSYFHGEDRVTHCYRDGTKLIIPPRTIRETKRSFDNVTDLYHTDNEDKNFFEISKKDIQFLKSNFVDVTYGQINPVDRLFYKPFKFDVHEHGVDYDELKFKLPATEQIERLKKIMKYKDMTVCRRIETY